MLFTGARANSTAPLAIYLKITTLKAFYVNHWAVNIVRDGTPSLKKKNWINNVWVNFLCK